METKQSPSLTVPAAGIGEQWAQWLKREMAASGMTFRKLAAAAEVAEATPRVGIMRKHEPQLGVFLRIVTALGHDPGAVLAELCSMHAAGTHRSNRILRAPTEKPAAPDQLW